jgi:hypothetical protein
MAFKIQKFREIKRKYIDIEPTWEALLEGVRNKSLPADVLKPACEIADLVRQAQKQGKKSITIKFKDKQSKAIVVTD